MPSASAGETVPPISTATESATTWTTVSGPTMTVASAMGPEPSMIVDASTFPPAIATAMATTDALGVCGGTAPLTWTETESATTSTTASAPTMTVASATGPVPSTSVAVPTSRPAIVTAVTEISPDALVNAGLVPPTSTGMASVTPRKCSAVPMLTPSTSTPWRQKRMALSICWMQLIRRPTITAKSPPLEDGLKGQRHRHRRLYLSRSRQL